MLPYLLAVLIIDVIILIRSELKDDRKQIYIFKPIATLLVIAIGALSFSKPVEITIYPLLILIGLGFSFGGDIALMFPKNPKAFRLGLTSFLIAHLIYSGAFFKIGTITAEDMLPILLLLIISASFFIVIRPGLESMKYPVIAYIAIISMMVAGAWVVQGTSGLDMKFGLMVLLGANLFYISDLILAANRFWKPWQYNRISLAFYYSGQVLIATSASFI